MSELPKGDRRPRGKSEGQTPAPRVLDAGHLFCGETEVWIEHGGVRYRLRITRRGRLILTK